MNENSNDGPMEGDKCIIITYVLTNKMFFCVPGSSASLNSDKENKTILERFGYTVGTEIGSGSYAKVKVRYSLMNQIDLKVVYFFF